MIVTPLGVGTSTVIASDPLTHTEPYVDLLTYSANWTYQPNSLFNVGATGAWCGSGGSAFRNGALYTGATFPNDQWAQLTVAKVGGTGNGGLIVRGDALSGGNGYYLSFNPTTISLFNIVNGANGGTLLNQGTTVAVGDVIKLSVAGSLLIVERNGVIFWQGTHTVHTAGTAGICGSYGGSTTLFQGFNPWSAGSFVYTPQMPGYLPLPINIPLGTVVANTWKTYTIPTDAQGALGVPPNTTTGVILGWNTGTAGVAFATRITGSTDVQVPATANGAAPNTQGIFVTGVSLAGTPQVASFDAVFSVAPVTGFAMWLIGFFGPEATFFTNAHPITVPTGDLSVTPGTIDLSATVGAGAVAVFADLWGNACRIAPHGDADILNWLPSGLTQKSAISGTASGVIDISAASGTTPLLYLRGYMTKGFAWRTPAYDVSPATAGSLQNIAKAPSYPAGTASAYLYEARSASTNFTLAGAYGAGFNPQKPPQSVTTLVVGQGPTPQINAASLPFTLAEQGYFISAPIAVTGPPTSIRSFFAIRTTSQT